jgi:hypothetical protein
VPDDVLEVGRERSARFRPPRWSVAAVGVALVAGAGIAAAARARPAADERAPVSGATPGPAIVRPAQPGLLREPKNIRLVTFGATASAYDVDSASATDLQLPAGVRAAEVSDAVALSRAAVVVVRGRAWTAPYDGSTGRALGRTDRLLPAVERDAVWLVRGRHAHPVNSRGAQVGPRFAIPPGRHAVGSAGGQLILSSTAPDQQGRLEYGDLAAGAQRRRIAAAGVLHSAGPGAVAWSHCADARCEVLVTDLESGFAQRLPRLPTGYQRSGPPLLAPDGRHFAVLARQSGAVTDVVIVGHLPGTGGEDRAEVVARNLGGDSGGSLVHVSYAANGWLVVATSDGRALLVGPGPHGQLRLPTSLPRLRRITAY